MLTDLLSWLLHVSDFSPGFHSIVIERYCSMARIVDIKQITALLNVVLTTKEYINLLQGNLLGLGDEEPDKDNQDDIRTHEEEERFPRCAVSPGAGSQKGFKGETYSPQFW
jgi:hypothetical protein